MKPIFKALRGSKAYGISSPLSDEDIFGIFLHTEPKYIIGLNRWDYQENKSGDFDEIYFEFRHFCNLLKNGSSQAYESLFLEQESILEKSPQYDLLVKNREAFLDSEKLFKCLIGYINSERKLAIGERTGKLGGKRIEQVKKFGYSPKNFTQLFRLSWAGKYFFNTGLFPVKVSNYNQNFSDFLLDVKTNPDTKKRDKFISLSYKFEDDIKVAFDNRNFNFKFNEEQVNQLILEVYRPYLL